MKKHIRKVTENRKAIAPYNFVELPDLVVMAEEDNGKLLSNDRYSLKRHTGKIECLLTTSSPVYIRCGLTQEQFDFVQQQLREGKKVDYPEFFYVNPKTKKPLIPGSSLRGMLRNLVEIISFSKIEKVSDYQRFFFRAVAADKDDPLKKVYDNNLDKDKVQAGYLVKQEDGWYVRPALPIEKKTFVWITEKDVCSEITGFIPMKSSEYRPQYRQNISFGNLYYTKNGRKCAKNISNDCTKYEYIGVLVSSGNMLESSNNPDKLQRKYHCLIREPDAQAQLLKISNDTVEDYCSALTNFQKAKSPYQNNPFDENLGVLKHGRVIFYCQPPGNKEITLFGQSPYFRIPYILEEKSKAATANDFIPSNLQNTSFIDIADAIFGFVRGKKQSATTETSRAGRIFISDAECKNDTNDLWWKRNSNNIIIPQILASPKPTTFQHYLVQPEEINADKKQLKHYASKPSEQTVIRGYKLYWHKGCEPEIEHPNPDEASETQMTHIKPIRAGVKFQFTVNFENLTSVELGSLMWILDIAQNTNYRLSLGMGKSLGMGAVQIKHRLYLSNRINRYEKLFEGNSWAISETLLQSSEHKEKFEEYMLIQLQKAGFYQTLKDFTKIPRIKMLLAMLSWEEIPSPQYLEETRYMKIERKQQPRLSDNENEYKERRVLPSPLQVIEDIKPSIKFIEGQIVEAKVIELEKQYVQGKKNKLRTIVTYEIQGSESPSKEEVNKQEVSLSVGDIVKVKIERVQGANIRKVKRSE
ncbi:TIGR03986 family CRISPR-associated RAMP protein [Scytonema sp. NUACC26]|uniref:TIGR03986 family type III CRISPR-associated RAMP protein n=1 Tax=Scytonema sp. NUACC26 TaxID=3140176 RepID=UPI0034DBE26E